MDRLQAYANAVNTIVNSLGQTRPVLYAANGQVVNPGVTYSYRRDAAARKGSLKHWVPQRLFDRSTEAYERNVTVERSIDLVNNDPHAAGIVDNFAATVIGSGLAPIPTIENEHLGLDKETIRALQARMKSIFQKWDLTADAALRMNFGGIEYLCERSLMTFGEYIILYHMIDDPFRPYGLALQVVNPQRLATPTDKTSDPNIKDGVELGDYGEPVAYWIRKGSALDDSSKNFLRIPARTGHRWNVRHVFIAKHPEEVRGWPFFAPAMKFFRDLNDFLDAELVANVVTSAFALFIKTTRGQDPFGLAASLADTETDVQTGKSQRYQTFQAGQILYGEENQELQPISPNRPGTTFEPFTKVIKKALSLSINMPYTVAFKDLDGVNFAGFRSAMLDAWRVFMLHRALMGQMVCQPTFTMLIEEAYLKGEFAVKDFYLNMHALTRADWRGSPKGDIEPIKAAEADIKLIQANLKTRAEAVAERGGDIRTTFDQLAEEQEMMRERDLDENPVAGTPPEKRETTDEEVDDLEGAGNEGM